MTTYTFPESDPSIIERHKDLSPLVNQLLHARGLVDTDEVNEFLNPNYDTGLHDPLLLNDMSAACERLEQAMKDDERIAIFSDYDCDGIPGAVVLHDFFDAIGYDNTEHYIPHRHYEGFGLSKEAVDKLSERNVNLIVTIDCGTSSIEAIAYAKEKGIDVIVTDHHEPEEVLPDAVAIVNPKLGNYPFDGLCGAAVAFKLVQAMLSRNDYGVPAGKEKWWLDMVGVATIADMVPLRDENRVLATYGLTVLRKSRRPGLQQLLQKARVKQQYLTEDDIGFTIGPRVNAASRMDTPEDAFHMLAETDVSAAAERVNHLEKLNKERKTMVSLMTKDVHTRIKKMDTMPSVLVMGSPEWRPSLVGLTAAKLAEEFSRPSFVWGKDGNGVFKGSCRSGGGASVVALMQQAAEVFSEYGGHHGAGGFSVHDDHIFTFGEKLNNAMEQLGEEALVQEPITIDAELTLNEVNRLLINQINQLAPYGVGNPKPLFAFRGVTPDSVDLFGKGQEHTKLTFATESGRLEAIAFFKTPNQFTHPSTVDTPCTLIAHAENSFFMGRQQLRLRIVDILPV